MSIYQVKRYNCGCGKSFCIKLCDVVVLTMKLYSNKSVHKKLEVLLTKRF